MPDVNYTISYNKQEQTLEFRYRALRSNDYNPLLTKLFTDFGYNICNIIYDSHKLGVWRNATVGFGSIPFDQDNIPYNEDLINILFLQGKYGEYINHRSSFLTEEQFALWKNAIKEVDKLAILEILHDDNKISYSYLHKHSVSLYDSAKYNLIAFFKKVDGFKIEKIDQLSFPCLIKEDIKHSFSKF